MKQPWMVVALLGVLAFYPAALVKADQKNIGLSDDQAAKLKSIGGAEKTAMKPLSDKQKDLVKKLGDQVQAKAQDSDIQATLDDMTANRKAMKDQREQFKDQRDAVLTPTQKAKLILMKGTKSKRHNP